MDGITLSGDAEAIRGSASVWSDFAQTTSAAARDIRGLDSDQFVADEADTFRSKMNGDLPPHLVTTSTAWSVVSDALVAYAGRLESLQARMNSLALAAADQKTQVSQLAGSAADARAADTTHNSSVAAAKAALAPGATLPADTYLPQAAGASAQLSSAQNALQRTTDAANTTRSEHESAVSACVSEINRARDLRFEEPPNWWRRLTASVGSWVRDHADILSKISSILKTISGVAGMLSFIPGMSVLAVVAGAGSLGLDATVMAARGDWSVSTLAMDAVGCIPGGGEASGFGREAGSMVSQSGRMASEPARLVAESSGVASVSSRVAENSSIVTSDVSTAGSELTAARNVPAAPREAGGELPESMATGDSGSPMRWEPIPTNRSGPESGTSADMSVAAHQTKQPVEARNGCGDPVDVVTGDMFMTQTDVSLPGILPLVLRRVYVSSYQWGGMFGPGWASTLDQRLEILADGTVCFLVDDGSVLFYSSAPSSSYEVLPVAGSRRWPLRCSAGGFEATDPESGITRVFGTTGPDGFARVQAIVDRHQNSMRFGYDEHGMLRSVSHTGGYRIAVDTEYGLVVGLRLITSEAASGAGSPVVSEAALGAESPVVSEAALGAESPVVSEAASGASSTPVESVRLRSFQYNAQRCLSGVANSSGMASTFTHDELDRMVGWIDRNGIWYQYVYDESGRCIRTSGRGRVLSYGFSYGLNKTTITDSRGAVSSVEFNDLRQVVRRTDPLGNVNWSVWDQFDCLLLATDALGRPTQFTYDSSGALTGAEYPDSSALTIERNVMGLPVRIVDPRGAVWSREYNARGELVTVTDPIGNRSALTYTSNGAMASVRNPAGFTTRALANRAGLITEIVDSVGARTTFEYNAYGQVVRSVDSLGGVSSTRWNTDGQILRHIGPDGARRNWMWDGEQNLIESVEPTGARTRIEIGVFDLPVAYSGPDGCRYLFGYDTELRLTTVQNPAGLRWNYEYDLSGRLVAESDFNGRTLNYQYDRGGQLVGVVNGLGHEIRSTYDQMGNVIRRVHGADTTTFTWDLAGQLVGADSASAAVRFERDLLGRVVRETINGRTVVSEYDAMGFRVSRTTPSGLVSEWSADALGRPAVFESVGEVIDFEYDLLGRETLRRFSAGGSLHQTFDAAHRLIGQRMLGRTLTTSTGFGSPATGHPSLVGDLTAKRFDYRIDGTLTRMTNDVTGHSRAFHLDGMGRIVGVDAPDWTEAYAYNNAGSPGRVILGAGAADADGTGDREYTGVLVTRAGRVSYRHDRQGRVVSRRRTRLSRKAETWQYEYDAEDRMVSARCAGHSWTYEYDAFGRRIAKQCAIEGGRVVERSLFSWDGDQLIEETRVGELPSSSHVTTNWEYLPGTWQPISQVVANSAGDREFFAIVSDMVGTPTELVTPDGARVAWSNGESTIWGAPRRGADGEHGRTGLSCPLRFPGQYADDETGLHYNRYRYYDPIVGRYTTSDPLGLQAAPDPHGYVLNPTGWCDPLGLVPCDPAGLRGDETNGGHTIARHVGKSEAYLKGRGIPEASTFPDLETASRETASNLTQNWSGIQWWLANSRARVATVSGKITPGAGVTYQAGTNAILQSTRITTVLRRNVHGTAGIRIVTSYPEP